MTTTITKDISRLQEEVLSLSAEERKKLLDAISYSTRGRNKELSRDEQHIFSTVMDLTGARMPAAKFFEIYGRAKFEQRCFDFLEIVSDSRQHLRPVQVCGLIELCLRALASELRAREIPVSPRTMFDNFGMIPHALDQRYPGYAAAGLLHRLARAA